MAMVLFWTRRDSVDEHLSGCPASWGHLSGRSPRSSTERVLRPFGHAEHHGHDHNGRAILAFDATLAALQHQIIAPLGLSVGVFRA